MTPSVLHVFSTFAIGGPQVRFAAIANHFGPRYHHAVIAMDGDLACRERLDPRLDIAFLDPGLRKGDTRGNLRRIRAFLSALRPAVMMTYNWGSIEWALANLVPIVRHVHMEDGFGPDEQARQLLRRVWTRRLALHHSLVMLPSRTLLRIATEQWRLPKRRLRYVPNGVDLGRFAPHGRAWDAVPTIGTVAALRGEKNLGRLLRAFAAVDAPARLVMVGDGPERAGLERLAAELGIAERVRFAGHVAAPAAEYAGFDLFALSSDTEQMPLSVLEAMAAGLPVAATDVGDVRAMLAEANDPFVVAKDDAALAGALGALLRDPAGARRLGAANREKAKRDFDETAMFRSYAALFDGTA